MNIRPLAILGIFLAVATASLAQESIPVHLSPGANAPVIGRLANSSLAIPAPWPSGVAASSEWMPIYYKGSFDVYIASSDIAKDLSPKVGARYLLEPSDTATLLALATDKDASDLLAVDPMFCKARVETIVTAYIPSTSIAPPPALPSPGIVREPAISHSAGDTSGAVSGKGSKTLQGILAPTTGSEKGKTGCSYKIVNSDKVTLAFLNTEKLPAFLMVKDYVNSQVNATGILVEEKGLSRPILYISTLQKTD